MKLISKFLIVLVVSTVFYTFVLDLSWIWYAIAEFLTLGVFVLLLSLFEALAIEKCEMEYIEYKKRQEKALLEWRMENIK